MRKIILIIIVVIGVSPQLYGQDENTQNQLVLTREFMRRVFDMESFDSIAKLTTLRKDLPLARFKYSSAHLSTLVLQLQIQVQKYHYSELSYIPYLSLSGQQRTLIYEKSTVDGSQNNKDLSAIYAIYNKGELVSYIELNDGKISGIKAIFNPGADYIHEFTMNDVDTIKSIIKLDEQDQANLPINISTQNGLTIARDFVKFTHDSLLYSKDMKDVKKSASKFFKFRQKLVCSDTLDFYTIHYSVEYLKEKIRKIPMGEIRVIPFSKLPKKQRRNLDTHNEKANDIYAVMLKKEIITYLCLRGDKIKYFLAFKNLKGQYVFFPYEYANQIN